MKNDHSNNLNVIIHGLHSSGSSALLNYLREFNTQLTIVSGEFDAFRRAGMVGDTVLHFEDPESYQTVLDQYLDHYGSSILKDGLRYYVKPVSYKKIIKYGTGYLYKYHREQIKLLKRLSIELQESTHQSERIEKCREWIQNVGSLFNKKNDGSRIVFDHAIDRFEHQDLWPEVFKPFKLVIVYRDPRDQFADLIRRKHVNWELGYPRTFESRCPIYHANSIQAIYGRSRQSGLQLFVDALNKKYDAVERIYQSHREQTILLDFESFILKHEQVKDEVNTFIGLDPVHQIKYKYLHLKNSAQNIGIYKNALTQKELESLEQLLVRYSNLKKIDGKTEI